MSLIKFVKGDIYSVFGTNLSTDYINRITIPTLLDALKWSPEYVLSQLEVAEFPFTRHYKLTEAINARAEAQAAAEEEARIQAERIAAMLPDPKRLEQERREREEMARKIREHGHNIRMANRSNNHHNFNSGNVNIGAWD